jgi:hypothetical protein
MWKETPEEARIFNRAMRIGDDARVCGEGLAARERFPVGSSASARARTSAGASTSTSAIAGAALLAGVVALVAGVALVGVVGLVRHARRRRRIAAALAS